MPGWGYSCSPLPPPSPRLGWSILLLPREGAGASLGSCQFLCEDPGEKQDPSPFTKGSMKVGWLFLSSQGTNNCKTSPLLFANPLGARQERWAAFTSWSWAQWPASLSLLSPQQSRESLDPNLGNAPHLTRDLWTHPSPGRAGSQALPLLPACVCVFFKEILLRIPSSRLLCHIWKFV